MLGSKVPVRFDFEQCSNLDINDQVKNNDNKLIIFLQVREGSQESEKKH